MAKQTVKVVFVHIPEVIHVLLTVDGDSAAQSIFVSKCHATTNAIFKKHVHLYIG